MSNKPSASKIDTVIKLILIFCITLLSFSLGTFVGKQVSDSEYRKAAIEGDYEYFNANSDSDADSEDELTKDDFESLTAEFVDNEKREIASAEKDVAPKDKMAKAEKPRKQNAVVGGSKTNESDLKKASSKSEMMKKFVKTEEPNTAKAAKREKQASNEAKRVAENKAPSKTPKKARKPQSILPNIANTAVGKYTVQVASYADEKEARMHSSNLKDKGWNAFYVPADVRGRKWFRVSVGLFSTSASAEKFKSELVKDNAVNSAYVQKIVQ